MKPTEKEREHVGTIAKDYDLRMVLLFGSQADGKTHKESDFDIAYLPKKDLGEREYKLNFEFTQVFGSDRVDTVDVRKAPPLLMYALFQNPVVLYTEDALVFPTYRAYAFKKFIEAKPLYEEKYRRLKQAAKQP